MFCYIKNNELVATSEQLLPKFQKEVKEIIDGEEVITQEFVDGMVYDEVIETELEGHLQYSEGKIIPYIETEVIREKTKEDKKTEIITAVDLSQLDLEEFQFSDIEIGEIITARVFGGNPYAQQALQAKILSMLTSGEKNDEIIAKSEYVKEEINKVRTLFNLSSI